MPFAIKGSDWTDITACTASVRHRKLFHWPSDWYEVAYTKERTSSLSAYPVRPDGAAGSLDWSGHSILYRGIRWFTPKWKDLSPPRWMNQLFPKLFESDFPKKQRLDREDMVQCCDMWELHLTIHSRRISNGDLESRVKLILNAKRGRGHGVNVL
jgi:hypothetical protein